MEVGGRRCCISEGYFLLFGIGSQLYRTRSSVMYLDKGFARKLGGKEGRVGGRVGKVDEEKCRTAL